MLDSETNPSVNSRTEDRRRKREKLKEKISQSSTSRVTYEDRLKTIHSRNSPDVLSRDGTNGPGPSTRKGSRKVELNHPRRSYAEAVKAGGPGTQDEVANKTRSVQCGARIRNR